MSTANTGTTPGVVIARGEPSAVALVDAVTGETLTYAELDARTSVPPMDWPRHKALLFLFADNSLACVIAYLTALRAGHAVALLDRSLNDEFAARLVSTYRPDIVWRRTPGPSSGPGTERPSIHPDLAVLLTTSGSTGSPKFVRLSADNLLSNTEQIIASLSITPADRAITTLPLSYSYGMSVLNTHLYAGASVVLTDASAVQPEFWSAMAEHRVTSLAGVPFSYQMLLRTGLAKKDLPDLRVLTQAGGAMNPKLARTMLDLATEKGWRLSVMYGQTEAGPRIACLPAERLADKLGSAGRALDGGVIEVMADDGPTTEPGVPGEIRYTGPNVMMGYAERAEDLALGDVHGPSLLTGDLGHLDAEGYLWISGRSTRFAKVFGLRINLDEVEQLVRLSPVAAVEHGDRIHVFHLTTADDADGARSRLVADLGIAAAGVQFHGIDEIPILGTGKPDHGRLRRTLEG